MNPMFVYKWYTKKGYYKGDLEVLSDFSLSTQINTAGSAINITVSSSLSNENVNKIESYLVDQSGNFIVTENGEKIIVESDISFDDITLFTYLVDENNNYIVTETGEKIIVDLEYTSSKMVGLGDYITVWRFDEYNPDGIQVFEGLVSKWENNFATNTTSINVMSFGVKADHHLVEILPNAAIVSVTKRDGELAIYSSEGAPTNVSAVVQEFIVTSPSSLYNIELWFSKVTSGKATPDATAQVSIYQGTMTGANTLLTSTTVIIPEQSMKKSVISFSSAVNLLTATTYSIVITNIKQSSFNIGIDNTNSYAKDVRTYTNSGGWSATTAYDLTFSVITSTGSVDNNFLSVDPSDIFRDLLDLYQTTGERMSYDNTSVVSSGTVVSYNFSFTKYIEALAKCAELSPSNWWWWVDPADTKAYLQPLSGTADHIFVNGRHLSDITIGYSLENLVNIAYLSGAETAGVNLVRSYSDVYSIDRYGSWLETKSDNRVSLTDTADILNESTVNQWKEPKFQSKITVPSTTYDIYSIKAGQTVGFKNFNELIDYLVMQIVGIEYHIDSVTLTLSMLPPDISKRIEDIKRNLDKEQTKNNE